LRIIAGSLRGRCLAPVKGRIRPTADRVREAIFNILGEAVPEARVLDLFAGTGALGIEALSRGAKSAVFVEENPVALKVLRRNLEALDLEARAAVLPVLVLTALKKLAAQGPQFDLVFMDPPYGAEAGASTLAALATGPSLLPQAWVVVEHGRRETLPESLGTLALRDLRLYGDTQVAFYRGATYQDRQGQNG
jgi:16S rRNA (guanine966-N2)-methyltransferase